MTVVVRVASEGDVVAIFQTDQALHRVSRRWIHADLAVPVHGHEAEGRVHVLADDREVNSVALSDWCPIMHTGAAERIDAQTDAGGPDYIKVDHRNEITHVSFAEVVLVHACGAKRLRGWDTPYVFETTCEQHIGAILDPSGDGRIGRATIWRIVFEATVAGRIVRWRDDDPVGQPRSAATIVDKDRM